MKLLIILGVLFFLVALGDILIAKGSGWEDMTIIGKTATVVMCGLLIFIVGKPFVVMIGQWFKK